LLVAARTAGGLTQFLIPAGTAGITVKLMGSVDLGRRLAEVTFEDVEVSSSSVLGETDGAAGAIERQLELALVLQCAETVGVTERTLEFTLEYANDRIAFGRPIGSYQALKHRFADMKMWLEASAGTATGAARSVQAGAPDAAQLVSVAKSYIGDASVAIIQDCIQMHGGIGQTWENDIHLYLRRATLNAALFGSPAEHRERLCTLLDV
jgi:alkylation response protein AidB-like acyl-CoA dehydrogenase